MGILYVTKSSNKGFETKILLLKIFTSFKNNNQKKDRNCFKTKLFLKNKKDKKIN